VLKVSVAAYWLGLIGESEAIKAPVDAPVLKPGWQVALKE
jgi:hypothetical protein